MMADFRDCCDTTPDQPHLPDCKSLAPNQPPLSIERAMHDEPPPLSTEAMRHILDSVRPVPPVLYAISGAELEEIAVFLNDLAFIKLDDDARRLSGYIRAARENGPISTMRASFTAGPTKNEHAAALGQCDFLLAQVGSLILRLAGAQVAAGLIDLSGASVYADRERAAVNAGLAQIAERNQKET